MVKETKKLAYESPQTEVVLLVIEQSIAVSNTLTDWDENENYDEDF